MCISSNFWTCSVERPPLFLLLPQHIPICNPIIYGDNIASEGFAVEDQRRMVQYYSTILGFNCTQPILHIIPNT
ncbi:hypothetical protein PNOK_0560100 [Pyrrhoderma noxium]|uniref:Uncharacterized protein n=1 Tax=Pyrrhoderma noxium TaxID=2282107 RepID=A0A286UGU1_9AGAM|nr:hypothetical protein PNOK_0560100 [Pyrrhoderma noxium]